MRLPGRRRLQQSALGLGLVDMGRQDRNDGPGHFILNGEHVLQLSFVTLSPTVSSGNGIDELSADADAIAGATDTSFEDVVHAQFATDLAHINRLALVLEA